MQKGNGKRKKFPIFLIFGLVLFFIFSYFFVNKSRAANAPSIITYQGKLLINNRLATTTQNISFILYDAVTAGNVLYTASGTIASPQAVSTTPNQGLFSVNLGDTGTNSLQPAIFQNNASVYLEVRIGSDTLSPRKRITSVPYAFNARYLDGVGINTLSSTTYIPSSDASGNFTFNSTTVSSTLTVRGAANVSSILDVVSSTGASLLHVRSNGNVGIGTSTPSQKLSVVGNISNLIDPSTSISQISTVSVGDQPLSIFVSGRYAYVANRGEGSISVVDVSNSLNPVQVATTSVGTQPYGIFVSGQYAYTADYSGSTVSVIDISNPKNPIQIATAAVTGPLSIYVSGKYAYTADFDGGSMSVLDISNPSAPRNIASVGVGSSPYSIYVSGRYAYVANEGSNNISVVDISNPLNPVQVTTTPVGNGPHSIYVSGRYAYTANYVSSSISIIDISNPESPTLATSTPVSSAPNSIFVSGRYAYIGNGNVISIMDISSSTKPYQIVSTTVGTTAQSVYVSGRYAYVANNGSDTISIVDISGTEVSSLIAHSAEVGNIQSRNDVIAQGNIIAGTSLLVGAGGIMSNGALSVYASSTGSTSSIFSIDSAQTSSIFRILPNGNVGIGSSTPLARFTIQNGAILAEGTGGNTPISGAGTRMLWVPAKYAFRAGQVDGDHWDDANIGLGSFAIGNNTIASNALSFAGGVSTTAAGTTSFAFGSFSSASGANGWALGDQSSSTAQMSVAFGERNFVSGKNSFALGTRMNVTGTYSFGINLFDSVKTLGYSNTMSIVGGDLLVNTTTKFGAQDYAMYVDSGGGSTGYGIGVEGRIQSSGVVTSGTLDVAESYFIDSSCSSSGTCPQAGDVVCISSGASAIVEKCSNEYDLKAIGIISTDPGLFLGNTPEDNPNTRMVALSGRVPVKVSTVNGNISAGDKLTSSNDPGIAIKATDEGPTVGVALEGYSGPGTGTVLTFVDVGWNNKLYRGLTINVASNTISVGNHYNPYNLILSNNLTFSNTSSINTLSFSTTTLLESLAGNSPESKAFILNAPNFNDTDSDKYILSLRSNNTSVFSVSANGDLITKGTISGASLTLGTSTNPGDLAERVDIAIDDNVEPGDVMIIDQNSPDTYRRSRQSYEQSVAGIISTNPTIIVGNGKTDYTAVMAMVGRVPVKVSNENGNIQRGDLLISATMSGYAMKYDPTRDNNNKMVAVIGVALEPLTEPTGKILSLIRTGWIYNRDQAISDIQNNIQQLANTQGINLNPNNNPQNLFIEESPTTGNLNFTNNILDLQNGSLINVASIEGKDGKWRIDGEGSLVQKISTAKGDKETYGLQSSGKKEIVISGSSALENGTKIVMIDELDKEIIDQSVPLKIQLTMAGETNGVFVSERSYDSFTVKENQNGTSNAPFDWTIIAKIKEQAVVSTNADAGQIVEEIPLIAIPEIVEVITSTVPTSSAVIEIPDESVAEIIVQDVIEATTTVTEAQL